MTMLWEPYLTDVAPASKEAIEAFERDSGKILPEDYKDALLKYQGMTTEKAVKVGKGKTGFGPLLFLGDVNDSNTKTYEIKRNYKDIKEVYEEEGLIPFASGTGSSVFCFDYRTTDTNPKVIFVDFEFDLEDLGGGLAVADSFTDLLSKLED